MIDWLQEIYLLDLGFLLIPIFLIIIVGLFRLISSSLRKYKKRLSNGN